MEPLSFDAKLKVVPVTLKMPDGTIRKFKLREMMGSQRSAYLNEMGQKVKYVGGEVQIKDFTGLESMLLSKCLYDENDELVKADFFDALPSRVIAGLFEAAQDLSGLGAAAEDEAKND